MLAKVEVSDTLLKVGENKITITVTPESGDKKVYQLIVNREEFDSKDNYLKSLSIDGYDIDFKKDVFNYELSIKNESSLKINAVKEVVNSSVSIIGNKELVNGSKVIIRVTDVDGNIRDYTDLLHLVILNNLQNTNAELIEEKVPQSERLVRLNNSARRQMKVLKDNKSIKDLELLQKQVNEEKKLIIN